MEAIPYLLLRILSNVAKTMGHTIQISNKVRDGTLVALKFFRPGPTYEGAVQRERYILDTFVQVGV